DLTRRSFFSLCGIGGQLYAAARWEEFRSAVQRFPDALTEFPVLRLTDPGQACCLPNPNSRFVAKKTQFIIYASARSGSMQGFRLDMKSGESRQITEGAAMLGDSLNLMPGDREFCHFQGRVLWLASLSNLRGRAVYEAPEGIQFDPALSVSEDGARAVFAEKNQAAYRLQLVSLPKGGARTILETREAIREPAVRPKRESILYRGQDGGLWFANFDGKGNRKLKVADGGIGSAMWSRDGGTALYLSIPEDKKELHAIREIVPETGEDRLVSRTSQFADFAQNEDGSVFLGASASKASPAMILLVREVRREFTICEHRASDPAQTRPAFSPNSQSVFFQSDRNGKMAIYGMSVNRLVEETDE
ncbi:MAG: hypothetical protein ACRD4P_07145, partial [Bryobacteraceae bacterium]